MARAPAVAAGVIGGGGQTEHVGAAGGGAHAGTPPTPEQLQRQARDAQAPSIPIVPPQAAPGAAMSVPAKLVTPAEHHDMVLYNLPGSPECEADAFSVCSSVVRLCIGGHECALQCHAPEAPKVSEACLKTHPCAIDAEALCTGVATNRVMNCLRTAAREHKLTPKCANSDPCLSHPERPRCMDQHSLAVQDAGQEGNQPIVDGDGKGQGHHHHHHHHIPFRLMLPLMPFHAKRKRHVAFSQAMEHLLEGSPIGRDSYSSIGQATHGSSPDGSSASSKGTEDDDGAKEEAGAGTGEEEPNAFAGADSDSECDCLPTSPCGEHLEDPFCEPCDE